MKKNMKNRIYVILIVLAVLAVVGCIGQDEDKIESNVDVQDCGISRSWISDDDEPLVLDEIDFEADSAMVCMGKNLLDNCKKSKATIESKTGPFTSYEIMGLEGKDCIIRLEQIEGGEPLPEDQKFLEDMYVECPMDIEELKADANRDVTEVPGSFGAEVYFVTAFESIMKDTKCTGTIVDAMRKEREKNT